MAVNEYLLLITVPLIIGLINIFLPKIISKILTFVVVIFTLVLGFIVYKSIENITNL